MWPAGIPELRYAGPHRFMKLKKSMFSVSLPLTDGQHMLFNSLTSAGVVLDNAGFNKFSSPEEQEAEDPVISGLRENGFLVPADENETAAYWTFYQRTKQQSAFKDFHLVILPTYKCNFRCKYCFEDNDKFERGNSPALTSEKVLKWLDAQHKNLSFKKLDVVFYGGEPLLEKGLFYSYLSDIKNYAHTKNLEFSFSIITNASLMDEKVCRKLHDSGVKNIQITIDGPQKAHDERRPYKDGSGSFNDVIRNLKTAIKYGLPITIRLNIDKHNAKDVSQFVTELHAQGILPHDNVKLAPGLVDPTPGRKEWNEQYVPQTFAERVEWMEIAKSGLRESEPDPFALLKEHRAQFGLCHAKLDNTFILGADGKLFNCYSFIGYDDAVCGDIHTGVNARFAEFMYFCDRKVLQCLGEKCPYVPICNGGCFYQSYIQTGDISKRVCQRTYFDQVWLPHRAVVYEDILAKRAEGGKK